MSLERTLTIIKPDGVEQRNIGDIVQIFEKNGLRIKASKMLHLSEKTAGAFYAVHRERTFFNDLVRYMSSGPVLVVALESENAVSRLRDLMGATDPKKADTDGDGLSDKKELEAGANPAVKDSDKDGILDGKDKCPSIAGSKKNNGCP